MPSIDVVQLVHGTVERNRGIPAVLDAYSEFLDSPIGPLELKNLTDVFDRIQDNLSQRFPEIAAKRAGTVARNDIASFLSAANGDPDRLKQLLRNELLSYKATMVASIAERFSRMSSEERRAIDATLRLIYRSPFEILFRADQGKPLSSSGRDFERFFASVKSQSPTIRELRYENLIVEKAIFNKLILKAENRNYFIWIPSFFSKEGASSLIQKLGLSNEHITLTRIRELASQSKINQLDGFLRTLTDNLGVLGRNEHVPEEFSDLVQKVGDYQIIPPIDLDDVFFFRQEESEKRETERLVEEERLVREEESRREEQSKKTEQYKQKFRPVVQQQRQLQQEVQQPSGMDAVLLGKQLDFDQLVSAINRRVPEKDLPSQVRQVGDYFLQLPDFRKNIAIVGASGSGRSTTLRRLVDGLATKLGPRKIVIIDQKGEHRGLAWKYGWRVYSFAGDSQAQEFQVSFFPTSDDVEVKASIGADLIQEWFNQGQVNCTDQQRERIASIIRGVRSPTIGSIADLMVAEPELVGLAQKLKKGLVSRSTVSRIFSETSAARALDQSTIFDISGRGLRDPTTKEERQVISSILLRELALNSQVRDSIIVVEDALDRFKSESLKTKTKGFVQNLISNGNSVVATSRSTVRDFLPENLVQILHRLSGEKVIADELAAFDSDVPSSAVQRVVSFLPRGYVITSKYASSAKSAAVRVEPLAFS